MRILAILLLSSSVLSLVPLGTKYRVDPDTKFIKDQNGAVRIFHGMNVSYKERPEYLPIPDDSQGWEKAFSEKDAALLQSLGFNFIRLSIFWEGVEPARGQYNSAYIEQVKRVMDVCEKFGIAVLLDLHQDAGSRKYCGEGMPDWAVRDLEFPKPLNKMQIDFGPDGYPTLDSCQKYDFQEYYFSYAVQNAFQDLFNNKSGIRDAFAKMWGFVAS